MAPVPTPPKKVPTVADSIMTNLTVLRSTPNIGRVSDASYTHEIALIIVQAPCVPQRST